MIPEIVIPTCTVEMNRAGVSMSRSAVRAARLPSFARSSSRARRAVISPYSAATKIAFARMRTPTATISRKTVTPGLPGRRY